VVVGEPVENAVHEGVVKGADALPEVTARGMLNSCRRRRSWSRETAGKEPIFKSNFGS
jgi:hypothetical protein